MSVRRDLSFALALVTLTWAGVSAARADDEPPPPLEGAPLPVTEPPPTQSKPEAPPQSQPKVRAPAVAPHEGQFGIYTQFGVGYRAIFRYKSNDFCGTAGDSVCTGTEQPFIEIGVDYGISNQTEIIADIRFGLADDFKPDTSSGKAPRQIGFAPGVKLYLDESGTTKLFTTFQIAIDRTDYSTDGIAGPTDLGLRNVNGFQFDVHRTFGIYVHVGETLYFVRWASVALDGGIGMQVRFP